MPVAVGALNMVGSQRVTGVKQADLTTESDLATLQGGLNTGKMVPACRLRRRAQHTEVVAVPPALA